MGNVDFKNCLNMAGFFRDKIVRFSCCKTSQHLKLSTSESITGTKLVCGYKRRRCNEISHS